MDVYVAVVIVVSILGFALIIAVTWLVYKWHTQLARSSSPDPESGLPPTRRLVIDRGQVVPADQKRPTSIFSTISSVRMSMFNKRSDNASIRSKRATRSAFTSANPDTKRQSHHSRMSRASAFSAVGEEDVPPLPGMPPRIVKQAQPRVIETAVDHHAPARQQSQRHEQRGHTSPRSLLSPLSPRDSAGSWTMLPEDSLKISPVTSRSSSNNAHQPAHCTSIGPLPPARTPQGSHPPLFTATFDDPPSHASDHPYNGSLHSKFHISQDSTASSTRGFADQR